jgi:hypothetical protein
VTVAGVAWREGRVKDKQVMRWAHSSDRWRRRLALVATVPLNSRARGGSGALRELSKTDPKSVAGFIRREDSRLASRVRREVMAKLETGRKVRPPTIEPRD